MRINRKRTMRKMKKVRGGEYTPVKPVTNVWNHDSPNQNGRKLSFNNNNQMVQVEFGNSNNEYSYPKILKRQHSPVTRRIARRRIGNLRRESGTRRLPVYDQQSNTVKSTLPARPKPTTYAIHKGPTKHIPTKIPESSTLYKPYNVTPSTFGTPQVAKPI